MKWDRKKVRVWVVCFICITCFVCLNAVLILVPRRMKMPVELGGVNQVRETPNVKKLRNDIGEIGEKSMDELIEKMSDDAVYSHTGLITEDAVPSNLFFDAVLADRNNRRLIYEIGKLPDTRRSELVLDIFERHFAVFTQWREANTNGIEEVAKFLQASGKRQFTRADFFANLGVGVEKFPEGWNRVRERSHAVLSATFLVATYAGLNNLRESLGRCVELQKSTNKRLESIGYPDIPHDTVGLEDEFVLSVLWYGSDGERSDNDFLGNTIRKIIADSVEKKHLKRKTLEIVGWDAAVDAYDLQTVSVKNLDRSRGVTHIDVFRWTCSDKDRVRISRDLLNCLDVESKQ